jgi:UTP--glucose-1-phosphate uridylyltransferase
MSSSDSPLCKAVIPAAGFGTRFLPATKSQPKEMLPIVDTPTIQYVVEEAVAAGITDILLIIGKGKRAIEEFFDRNFELEAELAAKGKEEELAIVRHISDMANVHFVWQKEMRGLGDAVSYARHHVGDEPFAVLLGDTIFDAERPVLCQLLDVYRQHHAPVVALEEVEMAKVSRYGVISGSEVTPGVFRIADVVEKPVPEEAPSNMVIAARYILPPGIFALLDRVPPGKNNEIQLTDALRMLVRAAPMYGVRIQGRRQDIGNKLDYIRTNVTYGLKHPDIRDELAAYIKALAGQL